MAQLKRSEAFTETAQLLRVPLSRFMNEDGSSMALAAAAGTLGRKSGAWSTGGVYFEGEAASGNTKTGRTRVTWAVPQNYVAGTDLTVKVSCRVTTPANTTATIDMQAWLMNGQAGVSGGDLCATAAQSDNSATWAEKSFTITGSTLTPGAEMDFIFEALVNDGGGATGAKAQIGGVTVTTSTAM